MQEELNASSHLLLQPALVMLKLLVTSALPQVKKVNIIKSKHNIFSRLYSFKPVQVHKKVLPKTFMIKISCNGLTAVADLGEGLGRPGHPPYFGSKMKK